jgi:hypothetical protein
MAGLIGSWRIVEIVDWERDYIDLVGPAYLELDRNQRGSFSFAVVEGYLDAKAPDGESQADLCRVTGSPAWMVWSVFRATNDRRQARRDGAGHGRLHRQDDSPTSAASRA